MSTNLLDSLNKSRSSKHVGNADEVFFTGGGLVPRVVGFLPAFDAPYLLSATFASWGEGRGLGLIS